MNPETLTRQIRESSTEATKTARALGYGGMDVIAGFLRDKDDDVRLTAAECLEVIAVPSLEGEQRTRVQDAAMLLLTDADDQTASIGSNILLRLPPKGAHEKLMAAFQVATVQNVREKIPMIAAIHADETDRQAWSVMIPIETHPEVVVGLHTGLARMGLKESRAYVSAKLLAAKGQPADDWIDRAIYMNDPWVVTPLERMLSREDAAYTVSADHMPGAVRVQDLAANAILVILKPPTDNKDLPVPSPAGKRRYSVDELAQVRAIAKPHTQHQ